MDKARKPKKTRKSRAKPGAVQGRPPHEPTTEQRAQVRALVGFGRPQKEIAEFLGIGEKTLRQHYADEVRTGSTRAILNVGISLYDQAVGRPTQYDQQGRVTRKELPPNPGAAIFFMKARAHWRERVDVGNPADDNGDPIPFAITRRDEKL